MNLKYKILSLFFCFGFLFIFCVGCSVEENSAVFEVMLLDGNGYSVVGKNIVNVEKHQKASFDVNLFESFHFVESDEFEYKDGKIIIENIRYDRTLTLRTVREAEISTQVSNGEIEIEYDNEYGAPIVGETVRVVFTANENYNIDEIIYNGKKLNAEIKNYRFADAEVSLVENNNFICKILGDEYPFSLSYDQLYGDVSYELRDTYRYGDVIDIDVNPNEGTMLNYIKLNDKYIYDKTNISVELDGATFIDIAFCPENSYRIIYDGNGGIFDENNPPAPTLGSEGSFAYLDNCYKKIERYGYSLIGFNTSKDGTGTVHSLGAYVSLDSPFTVLYAMWEKWTDDDKFDVEIIDDGHCAIKGLNDAWKNSETKLVVPEIIDNRTVVKINDNAFLDDFKIKEIVIPNSVKYVGQYAFGNNTALEKVTLFDSLRTLYENSFDNCANFDVLNMNSTSRRVYENIIETSFADKYMYLKKSTKKKIVTISGCSAARGLDGSQIQEDPDLANYDFINMGVHAGYGLYFMLDVVEHYINEGDIIMYLPELRHDVFGNDIGWVNFELWHFIESNYDMLNDFSINNFYNKTGLIQSLPRYLRDRNSYIEENFYFAPDINRFKDVDKHGYFTYFRDSAVNIGCVLDGNFLGLYAQANLIDLNKGAGAMNDFSRIVYENGAKIYMSYAPVYRYEAYDLPENVSDRLNFERVAKASYQFPVIGRPEDFAYDYKYMYDHVSHLATIGVPIHTENIKRVLKEQMKKDGLIT